jgi:thymidylate synthase (FAD)
MRIDVLASPMVNVGAMLEAYGYEVDTDPNDPVYSADCLSEFAGRLCYKSFDRPNPETRQNDAYLSNIVRQGHFSVFEHATVVFLVRDVSRSLLTELERHRHLSFSVVSQRYVDHSYGLEPVIPPIIRDTMAGDLVHLKFHEAQEIYETIVNNLMSQGVPRKKAREAARSVLPNCTPVDMVVSGNLRAWRDVIGKRHHVAADAEIQEFAAGILACLRGIAPNAVADIPDEAYNG